MITLAVINIAALAFIALLAIFLHGLSERDAERREVEILHFLQDMTGQFGAKLDLVHESAYEAAGLTRLYLAKHPEAKGSVVIEQLSTHGGSFMQ